VIYYRVALDMCCQVMIAGLGMFGQTGLKLVEKPSLSLTFIWKLRLQKY